jgi:hypothetical protein
MPSDEAYIRISGTIRAVSPNAVLFESQDGETEDWIPRSTIHGADETQLRRSDMGKETTLLVMEWVLKKKGFI